MKGNLNCTYCGKNDHTIDRCFKKEKDDKRALSESTAVSMIVVEGDGDILTASENGFGKRTEVSAYPKKGRGTQGVIAIQSSERNGKLVGAIQLTEQHEILLISDQGTMVRTRASGVSQVGRNAQGVTLMRVAADEKLMAIESLDIIDDDFDADADVSNGEQLPSINESAE